MDSKEARSRPELRTNSRICTHHYRRGRSMPIVRMEYVRMEHCRGCSGCPSKEDEALEIIRIVTILVAVDPLAAEEAGMIDQIQRDAARWLGTQNPKMLTAGAEHHRLVFGERLGCQLFKQHLMARHNYQRISAGIFERLRQGADHVGESPDLRMRSDFGRDNSNLHASNSLTPEAP